MKIFKSLWLLPVIVLGALLFTSGVYAFSQTNYTTTNTFVAGTNVNLVYVQAWGGGGGGGFSSSGGAAGGGGGGAYAADFLTVNSTQNWTVNVSVAGPGATGASNGGNGNASYFRLNATSVNVTAAGGKGGVSSGGGGAGGAGGSTLNSNGSLMYNGTGGNTWNSSGAYIGIRGGSWFGGTGDGAAPVGNSGNTPGSNGQAGYVSVTSFNTSDSVASVYINDAGSLQRLNVAGNLTLVSASLGTYFFPMANGSVIIQNISTGTYTVLIQAAGYQNNYALLTLTAGHLVEQYFMDSSAQSTVFNVRDGFGSAVVNATITFSRSINGTVVAYTQVVTDSSGFITVNLNPTVLYLITGTQPSGLYQNYTGSVTPNQAITYVIQFTNTPNTPYVVPTNATYTNFSAVYINSTKKINVTWEVISPIGDLTYFSLNTTYNNTVYSQNITGSPGGGIAFVNISNVNLTFQNRIVVSFYFKRSGYDPVLYVVPFVFEDYSVANTSITGGLFTNAGQTPSEAPGRAILGMILLVLILAGTYKVTSLYEPTVIVGIIVVGVFGMPAVNLFPVISSVISLMLGIIVLIVSALGRR